MGDARTKSRYPPRNLNLITGATSNTDKECSYVRGANGPRHVGIMLVEG